MIIVANTLSEIALRRNNLDADVFGRSAFNRYYYASYLVTRGMLGQLNQSWSRTSHKSIPELLTTTIARKIRTEVKRQAGTLISMREAQQMRTDINQAISMLSAMLISAYKVRCIADYDPDERVTISRTNFILFRHSNHEASGWPRLADIHCKTILRIWRHLALS